ncbi:uncharacterized protein LOC122639793 isoform X2 [Telopea speciosissima]|uniref:uncharacterized protein LOC122639793 isoform X2 n=1 Tax=Telopea speciosissima TaxID=54955 RepID=UPI001CC71B15|nr:uncharacterized protein LOC122639793 isoform X2 [Telopea speciosissima]
MEGEKQSALNILVIWRGKKLNVEIGSGGTLKEFGYKLQKLTNVKADTMRLLAPQSMTGGSKLFTPFSDEHSSLSLREASILEGKPIRMMGVFEEEIEEVKQNATADLRIAGFDEEEKRLRQRILDRPQASLKLPQGTYIFCDFRTLQIPGIKLNPPASEALRRMHKLAADPGIIAVMNKHCWRVGIMTEMAPVGYVGISPKCILGYNKNHGEEISLRLRTDDLKGFRKYESIKKTLLHELLNEEAASLDWTRSRSRTLSGERPSEHHEEEFYVVSSGNNSQRLGGKMPDQLANARASSVAAAYSRFAIASTSSSEGFGENLECHSDDSGLIVHGPDPDDLAMESMQVDNPNEADPNFEPDPDNYQGGKVIKSESFLRTNTNRITFEPDPDDREVVQYVPNLGTNGKFVGSNSYEEPDPDDSEVNGIASKCGVTVQLGMDDAEGNGILDNDIQHKNPFEEPDLDDSEVKQSILEYENSDEPDPDDYITIKNVENEVQLRKTAEEPDPDASGACLEHRSRSEPNPDDSKGNGIMQFEPDPDDNVENSMGSSRMQVDEPNTDDQELQRIQDPVSVVCARLQKAIEMLGSEVNPTQATSVLQTLFKIIRNVIEHPDEMKFRRLRKANPLFQRNVANYKAAMEVLFLVGFIEDVVSDEVGRAETFVVLKRNDPGLLWLAKSSLEMCIAS